MATETQQAYAGGRQTPGKKTNAVAAVTGKGEMLEK